MGWVMTAIRAGKFHLLPTEKAEYEDICNEVHIKNHTTINHESK